MRRLSGTSQSNSDEKGKYLVSNVPPIKFGQTTAAGISLGGPTSTAQSQLSDLTLAQALDPPSFLAFTPTSSVDPTGKIGQLAYDSNFIYMKTLVGWMRAALSTFGPPPTFNPSALPGLQLWLRADLGVTTDGTGHVTLWLDQSPLAHDVSEPVNKPVFNASGSIGGGQSTITFTGLQRLVSTVWGGPVTEPMTLVLIGKQASAGTGLYAFDNQASGPTAALF